MSFIAFQPDDTIISTEVITAPLWSGNVYTLNSSSLFTSSVQETSVSSHSYLNVSNLNIIVSGSENQFSISYGHISGSGSAPYNSLVPEFTPTSNIYYQYYNVLYGNEGNTGSFFNFGGNNGNSGDIFVINVHRARYKESLQLGSLNLILTNGTSSIALTDDSNNVSTTSYLGSNRVYNIVSGSNGLSYNSNVVQTNSGSYGVFLPDISTIILNPRALSLSQANGGIGLPIDWTASTSYTLVNNSNNTTLFNAIYNGNSFSCNSQEIITSKFYDVHVKYGELNYTTNPSVIDSNGNILYTTLIDYPTTYPTTVGLYDANNTLLAIAKLSKPLQKTSTTTLTLRVKLQA